MGAKTGQKRISACCDELTKMLRELKGGGKKMACKGKKIVKGKGGKKK